MTEARAGSALAGAIVVLIVIECLVVGTLHLALTETRLASGTLLVLRLRLAAESAARLQVNGWSGELDDLEIGEMSTRVSTGPDDGLLTEVRIERLSSALYLVRSGAEHTSNDGHARAALLLLAPALPDGRDPAPAAVSAASVRVTESGAVRALEGACADYAPAVALQDGGFLEVEEGGEVRGAVAGALQASSLAFDRLFAVAAARGESGGLRFHDGDATLGEDYEGVLVVTGDLVLESRVTGLVVSGGTLVLRAGAAVTGAIHAAGVVEIAGTVELDRCVVEDVVGGAGLGRPFIPTRRSALPAF